MLPGRESDGPIDCGRSFHHRRNLVCPGCKANGLVEWRTSDLTTIDRDKGTRPFRADGEIGEKRLEECDLSVHFRAPGRRNLLLAIA